MTKAPVRFETIRAENGKNIGRITLNVERRLNCLTLEMVRMLRGQLTRWIEDPAIACMLIQGAGDRAFCAGGDVQALYYSARETPGGPCAYAEAFFEHEYRMDFLVHTCPKPIIAWGHGIVMGGGLGILSGCSHRVVTETARLAMPEITIGLYPDVGGGWCFNKMPGRIGLFLAMTGAVFNAADARYTGLADYAFHHATLDSVMDGLKDANWSDSVVKNHEILSAHLREVSQREGAAWPEGHIEAQQGLINTLCSGADAASVYTAICELETQDNWLAAARDNLIHGSALSALVIHRHIKQTRHRSLREVFQSELVLSTNLVRHCEFSEGVRALLIEKDKKPNWQFKTIHEVNPSIVDQLFEPPWPVNPLVDLPAVN
jgi:enoyl-CoA hydratase/carnithine racemase